VTPVLAGIVASLEEGGLTIKHVGPVENDLIGFLIRNTHAAYSRVSWARLHEDTPDVRAENQLRAGIKALEIIHEKVSRLNIPAQQERISSCLRRAACVLDPSNHKQNILS
jgi:hypothetical protein